MSIHFRKFVSRRMVLMIMERCHSIREISFSCYASKRLRNDLISIMEDRNIELCVSRNVGRPASFAFVKEPLKRNISLFCNK